MHRTIHDTLEAPSTSATNVEATLSNATSRTTLSTKSKQIEHVQFVSTLSKGQYFTINSFDTVAVVGNKVDCCFDIVAGVDRALVCGQPIRVTCSSHKQHPRGVLYCRFRSFEQLSGRILAHRN